MCPDYFSCFALPLELRIRLLLTSNFYEINILISTGALAISVANPTDLVKVRLQAEGKLPPGVPRRYPGALEAYYIIVKQVSFVYVTIVFSLFSHFPTFIQFLN